jgi:dihydrofolate reductase
MPLVQKLYVTRVLADVDGDVLFPEWGEGWNKVSEERFEADEKNEYPTTFEIWER